ncbi:diacylglycerol/lipid kinase family protein [Oerskovia flava]|uniref:diacylglycerol/lipid kinase family protein n=1 Tax=Oerskovia flava TaxID=2986422 RepID=UPI00223EB4D3|nr:diacylglycerol kinase family protein [Oerskovia sp. JB1-3-2]
MSTIGVVVNPTAGRGRGRRDGARTLALLREAGHTVVDLSGPNLPLALETAHAGVHHDTRLAPGTADGLDALVVVGGDGMVHLGVNAVAGTTTPLGIVAVGSGNDTAAALGLPVRDVRAAVTTALDALTAPRTIDAATVRTHHPSGTAADTPAGTAPDTAPRWFCGVLSAGIDAAVNARANRQRWPRGSARYVRAVVAELARFVPYGYRLTLTGADGHPHVWESPGSLVAVANGPRIGGGVRIAPDARLDDGLLDVVVAGPLTRLGAARIFPGMYAGRHVHHRSVHVHQVTHVVLEATTAGHAPPPAFADGEHIGNLPLEVHVHPGALRVLAPGGEP